MNSHVEKPFELTQRHVVLGFVAFFVLLIGVQAAFITVAVTTHTGLVSKQPYRKGLNYADRIAQDDRQSKLGWQVTLKTDQAASALHLQFSSQDGVPVRGLRLSASIGRAVTDAEDQAVSFAPAGEGLYVADLPNSLTGSYVADIEATDALSGSEVIWRMRKRLWLKP